MKYLPYELAMSCNVDLSCVGVLEARHKFLKKNASLPNVVIHAARHIAALEVQRRLVDQYGVVLGMIECLDLPENTWFVDRIGDRDTVPFGSPGV